MRVLNQSWIVNLVRAILLGEALFSIATARWSTLFVAVATLSLTFAPTLFAKRLHIILPTVFVVWIVLFLFATLFLGEVFDFYERFWWWDVLLHGGSAIGFGLLGFLFIFMLFQGDSYFAPPFVVAGLAFCLAVTIGVIWEVFEFAMDQSFGLNMQKSGLIDTMYDLIVDCIGASIGALGGYLYLKGYRRGGMPGLIDAFVQRNRRLYQRLRDARTGRAGKDGNGSG